MEVRIGSDEDLRGHFCPLFHLTGVNITLCISFSLTLVVLTLQNGLRIENIESVVSNGNVFQFIRAFYQYVLNRTTTKGTCSRPWCFNRSLPVFFGFLKMFFVETLNPHHYM